MQIHRKLSANLLNKKSKKTGSRLSEKIDLLLSHFLNFNLLSCSQKWEQRSRRTDQCPTLVSTKQRTRKNNCTFIWYIKIKKFTLCNCAHIQLYFTLGQTRLEKENYIASTTAERKNCYFNLQNQSIQLFFLVHQLVETAN